VTLDHALSYREHLTKTAGKLKNRNNFMKLAGSTWGASANTLRSSALQVLCYSAAEYCAPVWSRSAHTSQVDVQLNLPRQQWSLLNRFHTEHGHCGACRRKWRLTDTDLCPCGETQTMSHIVESCPLRKLNGGLSRLHSADEDAVSWLTNYGS